MSASPTGSRPHASSTAFEDGGPPLYRRLIDPQVLRCGNRYGVTTSRSRALRVLTALDPAFDLALDSGRNARPKFAENFFEKLVNWDFVAANLG